MQVLPILPQAERPAAHPPRGGDADFGAAMRSAETGSRRETAEGKRHDAAETRDRQTAERNNREAAGTNGDEARTRSERPTLPTEPPPAANGTPRDPMTATADGAQTETPAAETEPDRAAPDAAAAAGLIVGEEIRQSATTTAPAAPAAGLSARAAELLGDGGAETDPDTPPSATELTSATPVVASTPMGPETTDTEPLPPPAAPLPLAETDGAPPPDTSETDATATADGADMASLAGDPAGIAPPPADATPIAAGEETEPTPAVAADPGAPAPTEADPAPPPPGMATAGERTAGAPFRSRTPDSAKPAEAALNRAAPFGADMPGAAASDAAATARSDAAGAEADAEQAAAPAEPAEQDAEAALDIAGRPADDVAKAAPRRAQGHADAGPAAHPNASAPGPGAAEGASRPAPDARPVAAQPAADAQSVDARSALSHAAARSYGGEAVQPATRQIAVNIARAAQEGTDRLTVHLRPASLGRISIELEVGHDHRVIAVIAADRSDTFELLQRDSKALERALNDAGLKADSGSLSFDLRGENRDRGMAGGEPEGRAASIRLPEDGAAATEAAAARGRAHSVDGRLDIRI